MVFEDGELTVLRAPDRRGSGSGRAYSVFRDQIEVQRQPEDTVSASWSFDGTKLRFTDVGSCEEASCTRAAGGASPFIVVWGSNPWVRVAERTRRSTAYIESSVHGRGAEGSRLLYGSEVNDENWGEHDADVLDEGRVELRAEERSLETAGPQGTYDVRRATSWCTPSRTTTVWHRTARLRRPARGSTRTRWSLYRDKLTLKRDESLGSDLDCRTSCRALERGSTRRAGRSESRRASRVPRRGRLSTESLPPRRLEAVGEAAQAAAARPDPRRRRRRRRSPRATGGRLRDADRHRRSPARALPCSRGPRSRGSRRRLRRPEQAGRPRPRARRAARPERRAPRGPHRGRR